MKNYICSDCNHKFKEENATNCPKCESENIKKDIVIPMFFNTPIVKEGGSCKDGICSMDD